MIRVLTQNRHKKPLCNHPECHRIADAYGTDAVCYAGTYARILLGHQT